MTLQRLLDHVTFGHGPHFLLEGVLQTIKYMNYGVSAEPMRINQRGRLTTGQRSSTAC